MAKHRDLGKCVFCAPVKRSSIYLKSLMKEKNRKSTAFVFFYSCPVHIAPEEFKNGTSIGHFTFLYRDYRKA